MIKLMEERSSKRSFLISARIFLTLCFGTHWKQLKKSIASFLAVCKNVSFQVQYTGRPSERGCLQREDHLNVDLMWLPFFRC